jgi:copper homeostasis protein
MKLEICTDNLISAIAAENSGADRIELCSDINEGGITPSFGMIVSVRDRLKIDINVLIRPRSGDFLYSDAEIEVMTKDIELCKKEGMNGIVIGILNSDGSIDTKRTSMLINMAKPMTVTFHRAFDMCSDPFTGLEEVILTGADRLLTSGQKNGAVEGSGLIRKLEESASNRIIIMPGGGISDMNILSLISTTKATEYHMTARKSIESQMKFRKEGVSMGTIGSDSEFRWKTADPDMIRRVSTILRNSDIRMNN